MNIKAIKSFFLSPTFYWLCLSMVLLIDQISKYVVMHYYPQAVLMNSGLMGGVLQQYSALIKTLFAANLGLICSICFLYISVFVLYSRAVLRLWSAIFFSSIFSNLIDRIRYGAVVDFIPVEIGKNLVLLNFADFFQQISLIMISVYLYRFRAEIFNQKEQRGKFLVHARSQLPAAFFFAGATFLICVGVSIINCIYFESKIAVMQFSISEYSILVILIGVLCSILIFILSLLNSFRYVGPAYALQKYLEAYDTNLNQQFKLRKNDLFKFLEEPVNRVLSKKSK